MSTKPSYRGLLNAIAVGEGRGYRLLSSWSKASSNTALKQVLDVVAIREQEHCLAFTKRMCELGYSVRENVSELFDEHLTFAASTGSDREKFETLLGYGKGEQASEDPLSTLFNDTTIDAQTGALLGRFIAEERDSGRALREQYGAVKADLGPKPAPEPKPQPTPEPTMDLGLDKIAARLDRLTDTIEELKQLRYT